MLLVEKLIDGANVIGCKYVREEEEIKTLSYLFLHFAENRILTASQSKRNANKYH